MAAIVPYMAKHGWTSEVVLPQISAKAVVYGGADRQSRRNGEVVPLADLVEVLERFDRREGA